MQLPLFWFLPHSTTQFPTRSRNSDVTIPSNLAARERKICLESTMRSATDRISSLRPRAFIVDSISYEQHVLSRYSHTRKWPPTTAPLRCSAGPATATFLPRVAIAKWRIQHLLVFHLFISSMAQKTRCESCITTRQCFRSGICAYQNIG